MPNHYHLLVQTPRANLSDAVGWVQTTYSVRFNRRHRRTGHLFQGRYKAHLVEADTYARQLINYIHLNPVRSRDKRRVVPVKRRGELRRYRWSSHRAYAGLAAPGTIPEWLCLEWLSYFGRRRKQAQSAYRKAVAAMFGQVAQSPFRELRGGLVLGSERLWRKALELVSDAAGQEKSRRQARAGREALADWLNEAVKREADRRIQIWLHVRLGGARMTEVARQYGYRDGSGVHRVVQRLENRARADRKLQARLKAWRNRLSNVKI